MPVAGRRDGIADYPNELKDSLSILPYKSGGTTVLGCTGVGEDLVFVSELRRFENAIIARGTHTGGACSASLVDSTESWDEWGVIVGDRVVNETDCCSFGNITAIDNATNTITVTLTGGTDDDFDACDAYHILSQGGCYRANSIRKVRIATDLEAYIKFDGCASACDHDVHLEAGGTYNDDGLRIVARINVVNAIACATPEFRFTVFGI